MLQVRLLRPVFQLLVNGMDDGGGRQREGGGDEGDPRHQRAHCPTSYELCVFSGGRKKAAQKSIISFVKRWPARPPFTDWFQPLQPFFFRPSLRG